MIVALSYRSRHRIGASARCRNRRSSHSAAARIGVPLFVALFVTAPASAEIYKCTAKKAMPTYQNFPCEFDSVGAVSLPTVPSAGATASAEASVNKAGRRTNPASVTSTPRMGMTSEEVMAVWGEPVDMTREEFAKGDIETWTYADSRSIQFDRKGRVAKIKW